VLPAAPPVGHRHRIGVVVGQMPAGVGQARGAEHVDLAVVVERRSGGSFDEVTRECGGDAQASPYVRSSGAPAQAGKE